MGNRLLAGAAGVLLALALTPPAAAWTWPVEGPVLRPFVAEDDPYAGGQHRGIDVAAPAGAEVRAPATGVASFVGQLPHEGLCLTIRTADGYSITLVHLGSIGVRTGTAIAEGEVVGTIGPSGDAEWGEPYVHLGIRLTAEPHGYVDPLSLLPARPVGRPEPRPAEEPAPVTAPAAQPSHAQPPAPKPGRSRTRARGAPRERARPRTAPVASPSRATPAPLRIGIGARIRGTRPSARRPNANPARPAIDRSSAAKQLSQAVRPRSLEHRRPAPETAARRSVTSRVQARRPRRLILALMGGAGLMFLAIGTAGRTRGRAPIPPRIGRVPLRKMSRTEPGPEDRLPEPPTTAHSRRRRVALREWPPASGPCGRLRGPVRHRRSVSPASRRSRPDGQRHRRARNAGDGRRRRRGTVAA